VQFIEIVPYPNSRMIRITEGEAPGVVELKISYRKFPGE